MEKYIKLVNLYAKYHKNHKNNKMSLESESRKILAINILLFHHDIPLTLEHVPSVKKLKHRKTSKSQHKFWTKTIDQLYNNIISESGASLLLENIATHQINNNQPITYEHIYDTVKLFIFPEDELQVIPISCTSYLIYVRSEESISQVFNALNNNIMENSQMTLTRLTPRSRITNHESTITGCNILRMLENTHIFPLFYFITESSMPYPYNSPISIRLLEYITTLNKDCDECRSTSPGESRCIKILIIGALTSVVYMGVTVLGNLFCA